MSVYEKLSKIQAELVVAKNKHNDFGGFFYRSCEDILQAVKPFLTQCSLILTLSDEVILVGDKHYIQATAILTDGTESISTKAFAREPTSPKSKMDESQTTGSASSYARKYALNGLFALDDGADSDKLNDGKKTGEKLITKAQITELKKLGFNDERLDKMSKYYKANSINEVTYNQAQETINKQKRNIEKEQSEANNNE